MVVVVAVVVSVEVVGNSVDVGVPAVVVIDTSAVKVN